MKKQVVVLLLAGFSLAAGAFNQSSQPSTTLVMRGTIQKYEPSSKILTLSTSDGTTPFTMTSATRVRQGWWHDIDASALKNYSGFRAAVRYWESGGKKIVESVHVLGRS